VKLTATVVKEKRALWWHVQGGCGAWWWQRACLNLETRVVRRRLNESVRSDAPNAVNRSCRVVTLSYTRSTIKLLLAGAVVVVASPTLPVRPFSRATKRSLADTDWRPYQTRVNRLHSPRSSSSL